MAKEYVLRGLPKGSSDHLDAAILSTQVRTPAEMEAVKKRAAKDGWHSFSVQILDLDADPSAMWKQGKRKRTHA